MRPLILSLLLLAGCSSVDDSLIHANEISAIASLRSINAAQAQQYITKNTYAAKFGDLAGLIPPDLATGSKSGYTFSLSGDAKSYKATAVPAQPGTSGKRTFFTDQTNAIRAAASPETAGPSSPEIQ